MASSEEAFNLFLRFVDYGNTLLYFPVTSVILSWGPWRRFLQHAIVSVESGQSLGLHQHPCLTLQFVFLFSSFCFLFDSDKPSCLQYRFLINLRSFQSISECCNISFNVLVCDLIKIFFIVYGTYKNVFLHSNPPFHQYSHYDYTISRSFLQLIRIVPMQFHPLLFH